MTMKHLIGCMLVLVGLFGLQSCDSILYPPDDYRTSFFFCRFFEPTKVSCASTLEDSVVVFNISGSSLNDTNNSAISQSLGDGEFKGCIWETGSAIYHPIKKMKVFTLHDYNEQYLAGSDISSLVDCYMSSYFEFVQKGYPLDYPKDPADINYKWESYLHSQRLGTRVYKVSVSDIDSINSRLIDPKFILAFREAPDCLGDHDFQLEINIADTLIRTNFTHTF